MKTKFIKLSESGNTFKLSNRSRDIYVIFYPEDKRHDIHVRPYLAPFLSLHERPKELVYSIAKGIVESEESYDSIKTMGF